MSWDAPAGADSYDVTYTDADNVPVAQGGLGPGRDQHHHQRRHGRDGNNAIDSGTTYIVGVRAKNAAGESAWVNSDRAGD